MVVGKVSKSPPILKSLQKSTGALCIITLPQKDQKLENKNFLLKWLLEVGMVHRCKSVETTGEKSTETRQHSGWEEIQSLIPITTFHTNHKN